MRYLTLLCTILISLSCWGQKSFLKASEPSSYTRMMDSISMSKLSLSTHYAKHREMMVSWVPLHKIKITVKTRVNRSMVSQVAMSDSLGDFFDELDTEDFLSLGAYDIRAKLYINRKVRLLGRVLITGIQTQNYFYSFGLSFKF